MGERTDANVEGIAAIMCDTLEYGFNFSDLGETNFIREKYIHAAEKVVEFMKGKTGEEIVGTIRRIHDEYYNV